jgi:hypothetical protein
MAKYPSIAHTPRTLSNGEAEGKQGTTHESAIPFPVNASQRAGVSGYSRIGDENRRWELLFDRVLLSITQLLPEATTTALQLAVVKGFYRKADKTKVEFAGGTLAIPDATTGRLVWIDVASNTLSQGAAWPATETDYVPIAVVDTAGGIITQIKDARPYLAHALTPDAADLGLTNLTAFTIDADNAGAGVTTQLRSNRGSTDAEDAALEWDETNDRWRVLSQHTTRTLCPMEASSFFVAGTAILDTSGTLVAAGISQTRLYTFGANGATPYGIKLTLAGATGAPSSGTHAAGEFHVDSAGKLFACTANGTPGTWQQVGKQDSAVVVSIADASGSSAGATLDCTIQLKDNFGNNLAQAAILEIYLMDDVDGVADAANVTAFSVPATGTLIRTVTANKVYRVKTNAGGACVIRVTNSIADDVFVLARPAPGSPLLDCGDTGKMTW